MSFALVKSLTLTYKARGALDPKLGRHVQRTKKITGPLLVQSLRETDPY